MTRYLAALLVLPVCATLPAADLPKLENQGLRLEVDPATASAHLLDKKTGEAWPLAAPRLVAQDKRALPLHVSGGVIVRDGALTYRTEQGVEFQFKLAANPSAIEYSFDKLLPDVAEIRLLDASLPLEPGAENYYAIPNRMGILLLPEGEKPYTRRFPAYSSSGYSMAMFGGVRNGSALLATWVDPYTEILADYAVSPERRLSLSLALRRAAHGVRLQPLGRGGYVEIAQAYRPVARQRGYLKTLAEKVRENPNVARFFGAADFKPFAFQRNVPNTRWNQTDQERLNIRFTFQDCAELAEHFAKDLGIDRALLVLNGWINGGYDNRHPDVLPAALLPMTGHRFVTSDRKVESTRFGNDIDITVNYGQSDYAAPHGVLPQWGFLIESPALVAFYARSYGGLQYAEPALFVIRSLDGKSLASSRQVRNLP
jgi:hypothetical protein